MGTSGTSQLIAESLGLAITHSALCPSGTTAWKNVAQRSARALLLMESRNTLSSDIISNAALRNAMVVHAACGLSLIHI